MQLARSSLRANNVELADYYMNECPITLRDQAWRELKERYYPKFTAFEGERCLAFSSTGEILATVSGTTIKLWDWSTQKLVSSIQTADQRIEFTPLGSARNGELINECTMDSSIFMTPIVANNVLYIATRNRLYAIAEIPARKP
jgi:WD40 repeat protein